MKARPYLAIQDIDHTRTRVKSPQINEICARFRKAIPQEFYQVTFRKKLYSTLEELQTDLDDWLVGYKDERTHQGKMYCGRPMATFEGGMNIWAEMPIGEVAA